MTAADLQAVYDTNVFGIVRVTHAFLPLLEACDAPVIVNVSSGLGSLAVVTNPERMESRFPAVAYGPWRRAPRSSSGWPRSVPTAPPAATSTATARLLVTGPW